jgi:hypothetical protein
MIKIGVKVDAYFFYQSSWGQFSLFSFAFKCIKQWHKGHWLVFDNAFPLLAFNLSGQVLHSLSLSLYVPLSTY